MPLSTEVGLGPGRIADRARPSKGAEQPPTFQAMSIVAKRSSISAAVEFMFPVLRSRNFLQ